MSAESKVIEGLLEKILGQETASAKYLADVKAIMTRLLINMVKLNAAMNKLNNVSGATPTITEEEIRRELEMVEKYSIELRNRMSQPALEHRE